MVVGSEVDARVEARGLLLLAHPILLGLVTLTLTASIH